MRHNPGTWAPTPLLVAFGIAAALIAGVEVALIRDGPVSSPGLQMVSVLVGLVYCLASLVAWSRRPSNRTGLLLTATGLAWFVASLRAVGSPTLIVVGELFAVLPVALTLHLLFAFPAGTVTPGKDRVAVAAGYVAALGLGLPVYLFGTRAAPYDVLRIADLPRVAGVAAALQALVGLAVAAAAAVSLRRRLRLTPPARRRALLPFAVYGVAAVGVIPVVGHLLGPLLGLSADAVLALQRLVIAGIPIAAVATMLTGGFARVGAIEELGGWLRGARTDVRDALAQVVGDPELGLGFRLEDGSLVDGSGLPFTREGGGAHEVRVDGRPVAVITFDPTLVDDPGELAIAGRLLAIWIERERLTAALRAGERELRRSRTRVMDAADEERRRIARDLHDGLASRLLLLAVRVDGLVGEGGPTGRELARVRDELESALGELRALVQGMMPAGLIERGLPDAIADLVDRVPLPTRLDCRTAGAVAPELETTAYFVIAEALANATRHAGARRLSVRVVAGADRLELEVADDGTGEVGDRAGVGTHAMAARVEAAGGTLEVTGVAGAGTTVRAVLPVRRDRAAV